MSGFGNEVGAIFGGEIVTSKANNWTNEEWKALMGQDKPENYWDQIHQDNVATIDNPSAPEDPDKYNINKDGQKINLIPGAQPDDTIHNSVAAELTGGNALNWETKTFGQLNDEKNSLKRTELQNLADAWKKHGNDLKTESKTFKETVEKAITGKWEGDTADAAEAATKHVTKNSIYEFTPASDEIANRLTILKGAFDHIHDNFPKYADHKLIDHFPDYNKHKLEEKVRDYNTKYHFDAEGHLRLSNGQYVNVDTAVEEAQRIRQSIKDYQEAVQLFRDTYNPTVQAITKSFPNLPAPPDLKFKDPTAPGGPGGPGNPGGPGGPNMPSLGGGAGTKPFDKSAFDKLNTDKPTDYEKYKPIDQKPTDQNDSTTDPTKDALDSLTDPVKSAIDSATGAAKDAAGQLADAMKNAAGQNPLGTGGPPEGVLGLGPQGLGGAGAGKGGGGSGGGVPLRGLPTGLPNGTPATAAAKMPAAATGAGAGLGAGAGSPGAGAPAAGQRGDQNGKGHQVNKALRRKKNGKDVIGDSDASVPVVGANEEAEQPESAPVEQSEFRRRIPQRDGTWQPTSAVQPGPASPARGQHVTPGRSE
ncbi:hypothetical protein QQ44_25025 [Mycolicibacterium setense]|uniref:ESX-1 secretion-associated protein EspA/EspE-like domain-containing protein n=1 Tax=Mycolicibacterium setense TaxID=431269 RepID=A0ABR4YME3_9MYCO|nr:hypothetical protein [Mycolicibacterium setense]KHO19905.1 hypothetical protein QQ44_25025 [Mycolicibacterium setense]